MSKNSPNVVTIWPLIYTLLYKIGKNRSFVSWKNSKVSQLQTFHFCFLFLVYTHRLRLSFSFNKMKRSFQLSFENRLLQNGIILVRFMSSSRILLNQSNSNLFNRFFVVRLFSRFRLITCSDFEPSLDYEQSLLFGKVRRASYLKKELRKKSMLARHLKLCEWGAESHIAHKLQFFFRWLFSWLAL